MFIRAWPLKYVFQYLITKPSLLLEEWPTLCVAEQWATKYILMKFLFCWFSHICFPIKLTIKYMKSIVSVLPWFYLVVLLTSYMETLACTTGEPVNGFSVRYSLAHLTLWEKRWTEKLFTGAHRPPVQANVSMYDVVLLHPQLQMCSKCALLKQNNHYVPEF